jgi:DNA replication protein DnaC
MSTTPTARETARARGRARGKERARARRAERKNKNRVYKNTHPTVNTLHFLDLLLGEAANDDLREQVS